MNWKLEFKQGGKKNSLKISFLISHDCVKRLNLVFAKTYLIIYLVNKHGHIIFDLTEAASSNQVWCHSFQLSCDLWHLDHLCLVWPSAETTWLSYEYAEFLFMITYKYCFSIRIFDKTDVVMIYSAALLYIKIYYR